MVADLPKDAYARVSDLNRRFDDLALGFVDASIIALTETLGLSRIATTDRRHFAPLAATFSLEILPNRGVLIATRLLRAQAVLEIAGSARFHRRSTPIDRIAMA